MKRLSLLTMALLIAFPLILTAQPTEEWVARYNGPADEDDRSTALTVDASGNVYVTGYSYNGYSTYDDYVTIKYNSAGVEQWVARYNGPGNKSDYAKAIAVDDAGNVYITGYSYGGSSNNYDYATIKYNSSGVRQWVVRYNGPDSESDVAYALAIDADGNIYVTGGSYVSTTNGKDFTTIKYDSSGVQQWIVTYNGPGSTTDEARAIALDADGNVYVTGVSGVASYDYATIKYNSSGVQQWVSFYNGPLDGSDVGSALALDGSNNVCVTGYSEGVGPQYSSQDYATVKYNSSGYEQWSDRYSGPGRSSDSSDYATGVVVDNSGNVYVTGYSMDSLNWYDWVTIKYDSSGTRQWIKRYDGPDHNPDYAYDIALDNTGNVYVTGHSYSNETAADYTTISYTPEGVQRWIVYYGHAGTDYAKCMAVDDLNNVYITGYGEYMGSYDIKTVKYSQPITKDVAAVSIDAPSDTVLSGYSYTPQATVANFETDTVTFPVVCKFDSAGTVVYADTVVINDLAAEESIQVSFADWTPGEGDYAMTVTTLLEGDGNSGNDELSKTVTGILPPKDVGVVAIDAPQDTVWSAHTYVPQATVANFWE